MKTQILIWIMAFSTLIGITACNTFEGMGEDIEAGGEAIEETASENKKY